MDKTLDKDYFVIPLPIWNGIFQLFGGGPPVEVEVGLDPKTGNAIPITQLHSFKITYQNETQKVLVSKYQKVEVLLKEACDKFGLGHYEKYRLRDFCKHRPGKLLHPLQIISDFSVLVNTEMLLEEGVYEEEEPKDEQSITGSQTSQNSNSSKTKFVTSTMVLQSPDFPVRPIAGRRASHQIKRISGLQEANKNSTYFNGAPRPPFRHRPSAYDLPNDNDPIVAPAAGPAVLNRNTIQPGTMLQTPRGSGSPRTSAPIFHPNSNTSIEQIPGIKGLVNFGNTCYLNSVLQCLVHLKPVKDYFLQDIVTANIPDSQHHSLKMKPLQIFSNFVYHYYNSPQLLLSPYDLKTIVEKNSPGFIGYNQQDAHELLTVLLDVLNESSKPKRSPRQMAPAISERDRAEKEWQNHISLNDTIIARLFHGQIKNSTICTNCKAESAQFSPFTSIILQLPCHKAMSPAFIFIPSDPKLPRYSLRIKMFDKILTKETFGEALSQHLGRKVDVIYGIQGADNNVEWIESPEQAHNKMLLVYEISDPNALYMIVKLAVNTTKRISPLKIIEGPYLIQIPGQETSAQQVQEICNNFFRYLYEPTTNNFIAAEMSQLIPYIKDNSDAKDNITVELSKSIFSKSLKFKPIPECPHVAARVVTAIIQKTANLSWSKLMRQTVKNPSTGVKKEVDLYSLINEAASPSDITESWKCYSCGEFVKPKKAVKIWRLPPVLIFALKRFEGNKGNYKKNDIPVTYPNQLQLTDVNGKYTYQLSAVCEHGGRLGNGHYIAHAKIDDKTWAEFNDDQAFRCTPESAHQPNAYMLFYTRDESSESTQ